VVDPNQKQVVISGGSGPGEIGGLNVRFVIPDGGAFGRDKNVAMSEATAARVSYVRDGRLVEEQTVTVGEAVTLIDQASRDATAEAARGDAQRHTANSELAEARQKVADLACMVCGGREFDEQTSREDSQWGYSSFRMRLMICQRCGFVMQFSLGRSLFVPG